MTKYNLTGIYITDEMHTIIDMGICVLRKAELNKVEVVGDIEDTKYRQKVIPGYAGILHFVKVCGLDDAQQKECNYQFAAYSKKVVRNLHNTKLKLNAAKAAVRAVKGMNTSNTQVIVKVIKKGK